MHTQALHAPGHVITSTLRTKDGATRHVWESYACHRHGGAVVLLVRYMELAPNTGTYILLDPFTRLLWDVFHNLRHQFIVCFSPCWVSVRSPGSLSKVASHIFAVFDAVQFATCCPNRSSHGPVQSRCATTHRYGRAYRRCSVVHGITGTPSEQWGLGRPSVSLGEEPSSATRIPYDLQDLGLDPLILIDRILVKRGDSAESEITKSSFRPICPRQLTDLLDCHYRSFLNPVSPNTHPK